MAWKDPWEKGTIIQSLGMSIASGAFVIDDATNAHTFLSRTSPPGLLRMAHALNSHIALLRSRIWFMVGPLIMAEVATVKRFLRRSCWLLDIPVIGIHVYLPLREQSTPLYGARARAHRHDQHEQLGWYAYGPLT